MQFSGWLWAHINLPVSYWHGWCENCSQPAVNLPGHANIVLTHFECSGTEEFVCSATHCPIISGAMFSASFSAQTVNLTFKTATMLCPANSRGRFPCGIWTYCRNSFGSICMEDFRPSSPQITDVKDWVTTETKSNIDQLYIVTWKKNH